MPEGKGDEMAECDSCHIWYHRHCMDIPSKVFPVKCFESQTYTGTVKPVLLQKPNRYSALWLCVLVHVQCTCMCEPDTQTVLSGDV